MSEKRLIVAHYQEDLGWLQGLPAGWNAEIVTKGTTVPNCGREAGTYAWWIAENYGLIQPDGRYAFLQGRPWDHGFAWGQLAATADFAPLGEHRLSCDIDGNPNHPHLPVGEWWTKWFSGPPPDPISFTAGAQFSVSGRVILAKSHAWWNDFRHWTWTDVNAPWVAERIWFGVFGATTGGW